MGLRRLKPHVAPEYGRELPIATAAQAETSPWPVGLPNPNPPQHRGVQILLSLPPQSPSPSGIPPCSSGGGQRVHKIRARGGEGTPPLPPCSSFCSSVGGRAMSREPGGPRDPLQVATASPASGITSPAGEDRAGSPPPLERGHPAGAWPRGAAATRPSRAHAQRPAEVQPRLPGSQPGSWRGSLWPSPIQRSPAGDYGNQKVLLEEDEPQQVGAAGACSRLACLASPPGGQRSLAEGAGMGAGVLCSSVRGAQGGTWRQTGCPDAFPGFGEFFRVRAKKRRFSC